MAIRKRHSWKKTRSKRGTTLTELLVATILLAVIMAALGEIMTLCAYATAKLTSLSDVRIGIRPALERIKADVKQSCRISRSSTSSRLVLRRPNFYLDPQNDPRSSEYDSASPQNPLNGTPIRIKPETGTEEIPEEEQIEYAVEQDPDKVDEFLLRFKTSTSSQIVAKGIIGPFKKDDGDLLPDLFTYLARIDDGVSVKVTEATGNGAYHGVALELEIRRPRTAEAGNNQASNNRIDSTMGIRGEAFTRYSMLGNRTNRL